MIGKSIESGCKYHFIKFLGEGISGEVYLANRVTPSSKSFHRVAVKILKSRKLVSSSRSSFEELVSINSPFCIKFLGIDEVEGNPSLIMDYVEGVSLYDLMNQKTLSILEKVEIFKQIKKGLSDLHRFTVHGDLSPHNILVGLDGKIKLIDYGLVDSEFSNFTPEFAHPDLFNGESPTKETDLFSLRIIGEHFFKFKKEEWNYLSDEVLCGAAQNKIGSMVHMVLFQKDEVNQTICHKRRVFKFQFNNVLMGILILFLSMSLACSHKIGEKQSYLSLFTVKWYKITVNGKEYDSPIKLLAVKSGPLKVYWVNHSSEGVIRLNISPGERILLNDLSFGGSIGLNPINSTRNHSGDH